MTTRQRFLALVLAGVLVVPSCGALDVSALPAPGNSYSGGYDIVMEFGNVLNLPARAKVTLDGTAVGVVTGVAVVADHVDVTARLGPNVAVPSGIRAVLQQATVLGDIYVALERPQNLPAGSPLRPGGTVPLSQTTSPPQLEDTIAHMADFVGSGSVQRIQSTIVHLNRVTPASGELRKLTTQFTADISDLSNNIDNVDRLLNGVAQTAEVLHSRIPSVQRWFSPEGMRGFDRGIQAISLVGYSFPSLGTIYSGGFWLVPLFNSLADAVGAMQRDKRAFEAEYPAWWRLFRESFLPQDKYPAINITSILGPDGRELSGNTQDVLRILGAMP